MNKLNAVAAAAFLTFIACEVFGQPAPRPPAFEVADIKPSVSKDSRPGKGGFRASRVDLPNATVRELIMAAYGVQMDMIEGGPKWLDSDRFDIVAKADPGTPIPTLLLMLQTLLEERFKLTIHREDKVMPVYTLVVGKSGAKLKESVEPGQQNCAWSMAGNERRRRACHNMTMAELARQLPGWGGGGD